MPTTGDNFSRRLESLDLTLFDVIQSQSRDGDRQSWLAVQRAVRSPTGYTYLEIGSHLGGSIQQHIIDPWCRKIISIDKRPLSQPDDSGVPCYYEGNSAARMLDNLRQIAPQELNKIICFDADAKDVDSNVISERPDFCFIDGEHTQAAALSDFEFCLKVCASNGIICFHDDWIIHKALAAALKLLRQKNIPFTALKLGGTTFGIFLRDCPAITDPFIQNCSQNGGHWLLKRRIRGAIPEWVKSPIRWVVRQFRDSASSTEHS